MALDRVEKVVELAASSPAPVGRSSGHAPVAPHIGGRSRIGPDTTIFDPTVNRGSVAENPQATVPVIDVYGSVREQNCCLVLNQASTRYLNCTVLSGARVGRVRLWNAPRR